MEKEEKTLDYWKQNAEEDYATTPISVLRYIQELEKEIENERDINFYNSYGGTF